VRAALELVEAVGQLRAGPDGPVLQARAAVMTGEAAVNLGAVGQGMVAGDLVNTASRLQSAAAPGEVLVGETTYQVSSGAITFEPAGEQALRGKALPVAAYRALRVVAKVGGIGRAEGLEPPFVGRQEDLRLLKEFLHASARDRRLRFVSVIGQAGTGKSRLVWELNKYIDGLVETINWHQGRSPAYGEGITFWALGEMVRKRAGLAEGDDEPTTRQKIAEALATYVPDEAERRWIEPKLLQLLGIEEGRTPEREELFAAWRTFFERVSEDATTVLVFEDIHWADEGLLDFISHLADWATGHPILLMTLARPDFLERRPDWGAGRRDFVAVSLDPLSDDAMGALLTGLVPGLPEGARQAILGRAEGIPLYAVETVRKLLHDGRIEWTDGAYRPVGDLARLEVPDSLHALIAARLDGLPPDDRAVLQAASILGQTFQVEALAAVHGTSPTELEPRLRDLVRREVLVQNRDPRSPERGQYGFVQALIREVAYATLARRDRRARHLAAARYFEGLGEEELAGALATHYVDAFRASDAGPEADALAVQARIALRAAAERAVNLHSHGQALGYLEEALTVTTDPAERAILLGLAGDAGSRAGRRDAGGRSYREAIELHRASGDRSTEARITADLGLMTMFDGDVEGSIAILGAGVERFADMPQDRNVVALRAGFARALVFHDENERAVELADQALVEAERLDDTSIIADAVMTKGVALAYAGRRREAIILMTGVLELAHEHDLVPEELRARQNISQFQIPNDPREGLEIAREGLALARRRGYVSWTESLFGNAAIAALATGQWDWILETGRVIAGEMPVQTVNSLEPESAIALVHAYRSGAVPVDLLTRIEGWAGSANDPQAEAQQKVFRAWLGLATGSLGDAFASQHMSDIEPFYATDGAVAAGFAGLWSRDHAVAVSALGRLDMIGIRGRHFGAYRASHQAGVQALSGQDAGDAFAAAAEEWRATELVFGLAISQMSAAALLPGGSPRAVEAEREAREVLGHLGAETLIARLDALLAARPGVGVGTGAARSAEAAHAGDREPSRGT
jgi:tetratricopeptide (TPR) repeat protein